MSLQLLPYHKNCKGVVLHCDSVKIYTARFVTVLIIGYLFLIILFVC